MGIKPLKIKFNMYTVNLSFTSIIHWYTYQKKRKKQKKEKKKDPIRQTGIRVKSI